METHRHFILHKPHGYLSQFIYEKKRNKKKLGELFDFPEGTMAIGRLDEDSEGLLLLTTDGMMSEIVRSKTIEKEYFAQVDGVVTPQAIEKLKNGVEIGVKGVRYTTKSCEARILETLPDFIGEGRRIRHERHGPTSWLSITLTEGKFRQVRKMTAAVGFPTLRLVRVRVGNVNLKGLKAGEVIEVNEF
ncbi:pseudouridine synthase [Flavobacterium columnare]|uniref:Pseudouridine synthase n=1 Tax=Flavobacterium columnare (strain ATCC 49512 / CIP 103533 / TG 44/87) TaxID=1041826 RepID=G8X9A0_FLACA|nr:pseudouridine synthase [Flavobacterium columnare]AEW85847.1 pseudouridine synthase [Flavobacterium columnare ATCC 49512]ANO47927.1 pseudouridine synthase [Flavobacterium columnare]APT21487.1 pseudouridine synthase [Flavobacterium columnare]PDS22812.1 pseudouridine synthase [Flavobacterium columnare] [Flavobacterium columnare NBRC 100251 = ATCC 23463]QOG88862.1 pseudouridine synthase [Flavobacterium columnare]